MITLLEVLWWIVLFPALCTLAIKAWWRRKLQTRLGEPPVASIAGFIFGGWYGFVVTYCLLMGTGFLPALQPPANADVVQRQIGVEFLSAMVGLGTAICGKILAAKAFPAKNKAGGDSNPTQDTGPDGNLNSI